MNRKATGLWALMMILGLASCSFFQRGTSRKTAIATNDSVKAILADPSLSDSAKIALASSLLKGRDLKPAAAGTDTGIAALPPSAKSDTGQPATPADAAALGGLLPLWDRSIAFNTFSGKAKVHYEGKEDKKDFTATIRMEKDRKIWISIVALGVFEAARALITPDSIIVLDRVNKEVRLLAFKDAGKLLPVNVDFPTLQHLLVGNVLHVTDDKPSFASIPADGMMLGLKNERYEQAVTYYKGDSTVRRQDLKVNGEKGARIEMAYTDYHVQDGRPFADGRVINIQDATGNYHVEMNFSKAEFDGKPDFSFSVPDKYTRK